MSDEPGEVIPFIDAKTAVPIRRKERDYSKRECEHLRIEVDEKRRIVTCLICDEKLDPVSALLGFADYFRHVEWQAKLVSDFEKKDAERREARSARYKARKDYCPEHDMLRRHCEYIHERNAGIRALPNPSS